MAQRIEALEELARDMVGDGKSPNVYFVTDRGNVIMVTISQNRAYEYWQGLSRRGPLVESVLEDRLTGVLACVEPIEEGSAELIVWDDVRG